MYNTEYDNGVLICCIHKTPISKSHGRFFCLKCQREEDKTGIDKEDYSLAYHKQNHTDYYQATIGLKIAELLRLSQNRDGRYFTTYGTKTPLGLYLSIQRIVSDD